MEKRNNVDTPFVSVCLISYNHAKYIREAIESVLAQQVDFSWEIVIADDFSTDGTRDIISEYYDKYPHLIRPILQPHNIGPANNVTELFLAARGKYIAYIEGDDYWIDRNKLQKQFNFLQSNPDCSICFHRIYEKYGSQKPVKADLISPNVPDKDIYTIEDLAVTNFIPSVSVFFRNGLIGTFPSWYFECAAGDYALHILNAKKGKIGFIPDFMAVYRRHENGLWGVRNHKYRYERLLTVLDFFITEFRDQKNICIIFEYQYAFLCAQLSELEYKEGNKAGHLEYLKKAFSRSEPFMNEWLENVKKTSHDFYQSMDYKIGWTLRHPWTVFKLFRKNLWSKVKNLMFR